MRHTKTPTNRSPGETGNVKNKKEVGVLFVLRATPVCFSRSVSGARLQGWQPWHVLERLWQSNHVLLRAGCRKMHNISRPQKTPAYYVDFFNTRDIHMTAWTRGISGWKAFLACKLEFARYRHCPYYVGRGYVMEVLSSYSKTCITCIQAIYRPFRRVLRQQTCWCDRLNKRKTFIAIVVFCEPASRTRLLYETPAPKY